MNITLALTGVPSGVCSMLLVSSVEMEHLLNDRKTNTSIILTKLNNDAFNTQLLMRKSVNNEHVITSGIQYLGQT